MPEPTNRTRRMMGCPNPSCTGPEFVPEDECDQGNPARWFLGEPPDYLACSTCGAPLYYVDEVEIEGITDAGPD